MPFLPPGTTIRVSELQIAAQLAKMPPPKNGQHDGPHPARLAKLLDDALEMELLTVRGRARHAGGKGGVSLPRRPRLPSIADPLLTPLDRGGPRSGSTRASRPTSRRAGSTAPSSTSSGTGCGQSARSQKVHWGPCGSLSEMRSRVGSGLRQGAARAAGAAADRAQRALRGGDALPAGHQGDGGHHGPPPRRGLLRGAPNRASPNEWSQLVWG